MHCPLCGGKLKLVPRKEKEFSFLTATAEEIDAYYEEIDSKPKIEREEYECTGRRCFRADYPLYYHHPFRGIDSMPGDSWSLSWVK